MNDERLADGMLRSTVTYLEMTERPTRSLRPPPRDELAIVRAVQPTVSFYRFLYDTVGADWLWVDRRLLADEALRAEIQHPSVELYVLHAAGVPAGFAEVDFRGPKDSKTGVREPAEAELKYFGILPEFIGQKLGPYLLDWSIERAWSRGIQRYWLHTCTRDHPAALPMYKRAGFRPFREEEEIVPDPRVHFPSRS